jgi:hypothetical protein
MDMIAAYTDVGSYRAAAALCGCDPKTVSNCSGLDDGSMNGLRRLHR